MAQAKDKDAGSKPARRGAGRITMYFFVLLAAGLLLAAWKTHGKLAKFPPGPRAAEKKYTDLKSFYQFYRTQHASEESVFMHVVGSTIVLLYVWLRPRYLLSASIALSIGYMLCEVTASQSNGWIEAAVMAVVFLFCNRVLTSSTGWHLLFIGYAFAWIGHFYFEKNQPATFIYPSYSLLSDYYQLYEVAAGRLPVKVPAVIMQQVGPLLDPLLKFLH